MLNSSVLGGAWWNSS